MFITQWKGVCRGYCPPTYRRDGDFGMFFCHGCKGPLVCVKMRNPHQAPYVPYGGGREWGGSGERHKRVSYYLWVVYELTNPVADDPGKVYVQSTFLVADEPTTPR